jgi:hypothetical protein
MLRPYAQSRQINGLISGWPMPSAMKRHEQSPRLARSYWDAFGVGMMLAVAFDRPGQLVESLHRNSFERRAEAAEE